MSKQELFLELIDMILVIKRGEDLSSLPDRSKRFQENISKLDSADTLWLNNEYAKWFATYIQPTLKDLDPSIQESIKNMQRI